MHLRRVTELLFVLLAFMPTGQAADLEGNDLILTDGTPGIAFDDTETGTGPSNWDWTIRGREEHFRVYDQRSGLTWLRADLGTNSAAFGRNAVASGTDSQAFGNLASAVGNRSTAIGYTAVAINSASDALAIGVNAQANGAYSSAIGYSAVTGGQSSQAIGLGALTVSNRSTAIGFRSYVNKIDSLVLGAIMGVNGAFADTDVGIGTSAPQAALHIMRTDATAQILVEDTDVSSTPKTLFKLSSNFNAKFEIDNTDGALWAFTNAGTDFRISRQGSGVVEFSVANNGNATLAGALTQNSDVNAKQAIVPVDSAEILDKVATLPISQWQYKDEAGVNHIGPMAQDFHAAFEVGASNTGLSSIDTAGVALAAIQALAARNAALEQEVRELKALVLRQAQPALAMQTH